MVTVDDADEWSAHAGTISRNARNESFILLRRRRSINEWAVFRAAFRFCRSTVSESAAGGEGDEGEGEASWAVTGSEPVASEGYILDECAGVVDCADNAAAAILPRGWWWWPPLVPAIRGESETELAGRMSGERTAVSAAAAGPDRDLDRGFALGWCCPGRTCMIR